MEKFFCVDCLTVAPLTAHGRCATCFSQAVVSAESVPYQVRIDKDVRKKHEVRELERMAKL